MVGRQLTKLSRVNFDQSGHFLFQAETAPDEINGDACSERKKIELLKGKAPSTMAQLHCLILGVQIKMCETTTANESLS